MNKYSLDTTGLKIIDLNGKDYCIIHWISVLLRNRNVTISSNMELQAMNYILENFPVDIDNYDIIIEYRADDSYFSYARDFFSDAITVKRLSQVMKLDNLGNQIVLKSKLAFSRIKFLGYTEDPPYQLPDNFEIIVKRYHNKEIIHIQAIKMLQMKRSTFLKYSKVIK